MNLSNPRLPFWSSLAIILLTLSCISSQGDDPTSKEEFDYVIIGGGTAGLVVASRLTENPKTTVLVLEAGGSGLNNPGISVPGLAGSTFRSPVDWNYSTVALEHAGKRAIIYPRGKVLGGSSALNFILATKPSRHDYDTIEKLGNPGWGWTEFDRASKKSEKFLLPQPPSNFSFVRQDHGTNGSVSTSFPRYIPPTFPNYFPAVKELGHHAAAVDTFGGDMKGPYIFPSTINERAERVTSATAYYFPHKSRPNLIVRTDCEVDRLWTSKSTTGKVTVKAVHYASQGVNKQAHARREVILSAGSIGSPAILERSGLGDPAILEKLDIPVVLKLPGVGSNLADHTLVTNTYQLRPGFTSGDDLTTNTTFAAEQQHLYDTQRQGILSSATPILDFEPLNSFLSKEDISEGMSHLQTKPSHFSPDLFEAIKEQIQKGTPIEFVPRNAKAPGMPPSNASYITIMAAIQYPLSRGSSHITSRDPTKPPSIDPGYLTHPFDLWLLAKASKHIRKIMERPSWQHVISNEASPGPGVKSDQDWRNYTTSAAGTTYHPISTAPMLPLECGGVVSPDLRVYGTDNLRIIDASIIPTHLAMHPQMTVYALAEIGAEKILKSSTTQISKSRTTQP